jgi:hypothetical protein
VTFILEQISHRFVAQVSDRLLTKDGKVWDPRANKTLVFVAQDAVVAMSYTGDGDIGLMPTDQFIAESLSGHHWGNARVPILTGGMPASWLPLRDTLERLCDRLNAEFRFVYARRAETQLCEILIGGWQRLPDGTAEPIVANVQKAPGKREFETWQTAVPPGDNFILAATPPGNTTDDEIGHLRARLRNALTADDAATAMVEAIRDVSAHCSYVGPNCMCVLIPPPSERRIRVRCVSVDRDLLALAPRRGGPPKAALPATFTPWLIGP